MIRKLLLEITEGYLNYDEDTHVTRTCLLNVFKQDLLLLTLDDMDNDLESLYER